MLEISYEDGQLLLRALKGHATRMLKIAESEQMIQQSARAEVAFREAKLATEMADRIERNGVRITN